MKEVLESRAKRIRAWSASEQDESPKCTFLRPRRRARSKGFEVPASNSLMTIPVLAEARAWLKSDMGELKVKIGWIFADSRKENSLKFCTSATCPPHVMQFVGDSVEEGCLAYPKVSTDNYVHPLRECME